MDFRLFYETYQQDVDYLNRMHSFDTSYMQLRVIKMKVFFLDNYKALRKSAVEHGCYSEFIALLRKYPELCLIKGTRSEGGNSIPQNDRHLSPDWPDDE